MEGGLFSRVLEKFRFLEFESSVLIFSFLTVSSYLVDKHGVLTTFRVAFYFIDYSQEFLKRAFIGELFRLAGVELSYFNILVFSYVFMFLFVVLFALFIKVSLKEVRTNKVKNILYLIIVLCPATLLQAGYDFGRSDYILFSFLFIFMILNDTSWKLNYLYAPLILVVSLLIHEVALFITIPVVIAVVLIEREKYTYPFLALNVLLTAITIGIVMLYGKADVIGRDYFFSILSEGKIDFIGIEGFQGSVLAVLTRSVFDNAVYAYNSLNVKKIINIILSLAVVGLYFEFVYSRIIKASKSSNLLALLPFVILGLFLLGHDWSRWSAHVVLSMFVIGLYLISRMSSKDHEKLLVLERAIPMSIFLFMLGPLGVTTTFPRLKVVYKFFMKLLNI